MGILNFLGVFMQWLFKTYISHRGLHSNAICENSLSAFKQSKEEGFAIELDIQLTKDKQLIVFHDENTDRLTNQNFVIAQTNYNELQSLKLLNTQDSIPLLSEVLHLINGNVPLLIEVKNENFNGEIEELLSLLLENYEGKIAVCSFNVKSVQWFKNHRPRIVRGLNFGDINQLDTTAFLRFLYYVMVCKPQFISLDYALLNSSIAKFCNFLKLPMLCWTINTKQKKQNALSKVQNIIFERIIP